MWHIAFRLSCTSAIESNVIRTQLQKLDLPYKHYVVEDTSYVVPIHYKYIVRGRVTLGQAQAVCAPLQGQLRQKAGHYCYQHFKSKP